MLARWQSLRENASRLEGTISTGLTIAPPSHCLPTTRFAVDLWLLAKSAASTLGSGEKIDSCPTPSSLTCRDSSVSYRGFWNSNPASPSHPLSPGQPVPLILDRAKFWRCPHSIPAGKNVEMKS